MDKIAVISDIHGNMPALEAVLNDIRQRGIEQIFCLGDLAGKGPLSAEAVDTIREVCDVVVLGNWDLMLAGEVEHPAMIWWKQQLGADRCQYLGNLPYCHDLLMSGQPVRFYHASQESVFFRVGPYHERDILAAMFTNSEATGFANPEPTISVYGDIHAAYLLPVKRRNQLINVGSVGNPLDQTLATYVVLSGNIGATKQQDISVEFVRVAYDVERTIQQAIDLEMPETEPLARELRTGVYRGAKEE
ncbi:MAG: metallophosphoesterase family protein [Chloroflexota bacterium]